MTRPWLARILTLLTLTGACASSPSPVSADHTPYTLSVEDAHGRALSSYHHGGKTYVLGQVGERYVIRVSNHTARRVEAVLSVDGRDVLSGQVGDYTSQRGYVVEPYESITVEGFRQSLYGVAAFRFASPGDSYSARMGTPQNLGIIGAAFFEERLPQRRRTGHLHVPKPGASRNRKSLGGGATRSRGAESQDRAPSAAEGEAPAAERSTSGAPAEVKGRHSQRSDAHDYGYGHGDDYAPNDHSHIGTEYGEHRHSEVREVRFVRRFASPTRVVTLRYDDAQGLRARGIDLYPHRHAHAHDHGPQAFPVSRFAPPPPPRY